MTSRPELPDPDGDPFADVDDGLEALGEQEWTISAVDPETGEVYSAPISRRQFAAAQSRTVPRPWDTYGS